MQGRATIFGHPLHPILIPVPTVAFFGVLALDIAYRATNDAPFYAAAKVAVTTGFVFSVLAAVAGFVDLRTAAIPRSASSTARRHLVSGALVTLLYLTGVLLHQDPARSSGAVAAAALGSVVVLIAGALGGHLAFFHGVGVATASTESVTRTP